MPVRAPPPPPPEEQGGGRPVVLRPAKDVREFEGKGKGRAGGWSGHQALPGPSSSGRKAWEYEEAEEEPDEMDHSGWPAREVQQSGHGGGSCSGYWPDAPASPPGQPAHRYWRNDDGCAGSDRRAGGGGQWGSWGRDQAASPGSPEALDPAWAKWQPSTGQRSSDEEEAQEERGSYMAPRPKLVPRRATGPPASYAPGLVDFEAWAEAEVPDGIYEGLEETHGIDESDLKLVSGM